MGELKYFSVDSHTIYPPRLAFKWDDSVHSSQSLAKQKGELSVSLYRNREEYFFSWLQFFIRIIILIILY